MKTIMLTTKHRNRLIIAGLAAFVLLLAFSLPTRLRVADASRSGSEDQTATSDDQSGANGRPRTLRRRNPERERSVSEASAREAADPDAPLPFYYRDRIALLEEERDLLELRRERQKGTSGRLIASSVQEGHDSTVVVSALAESSNPDVMQQVNLIDGQRPAMPDRAGFPGAERPSRGAWLNGLIEVE